MYQRNTQQAQDMKQITARQEKPKNIYFTTRDDDRFLGDSWKLIAAYLNKKKKVKKEMASALRFKTQAILDTIPQEFKDKYVADLADKKIKGNKKAPLKREAVS